MKVETIGCLRQTKHYCFRINARQSGTALVISMLLLLVMAMASVASMQGTVLEEKMAGNTRDRHLAFQAAEAAITAGEQYVQDTDFVPANHTDTCTGGLCTRREDDATYDKDAAPGDTGWVDNRWELNGALDVWADASGRYRQYIIDIPETFQRPRYIVEFVGYTPTDASQPITTNPPRWYDPVPFSGDPGYQAEWSELYRITALGYGGTPTARAMVQTTFVK